MMLAVSALVAEAQMTTDNSYLRENYRNSKTAKKAAEKKANKAKLKAIRDAEKKSKQADKAKMKELKEKYKAEANAQPTSSQAQKLTAQLKDSAYLAGALPVTQDGVVCFDHTFDLNGLTKEKAYSVFKEYANEIINKSKNLELSRIISESNDTLVASICEPLYFKRKKWEADSTIIKYRYEATVKEQTATVRIWFISYCYEQSESAGFNYRAEEWITDKYALSKDGLTLLKLPGKFRRKTIDYVNEVFALLEDRINSSK